ncbi:MAG: long-chain-fatty-acid--CoA ligase [Kofleriaceae bacterium]
MMDKPLLISSILDFAARFHGATEVVSRSVDGSVHRTSWAEIASRAQKLASALSALGVRPGDRVATLAWNTHRHLELYFAVSGMGAVLHTINPRLSPEQLRYVVDHAQDTALFFDSTFAKLAQLASTFGVIKHFVALSERAAVASEPGLAAVRDYEELVASGAADFAWPQLDERTASSLCYTSGTSGDPKGVLYSHRSTVLHCYAVSLADTLALSTQDVTLPVVPMFHVNAWGVPYAMAMVGGKLVLPGPGLDGKSLLELIDRERVTSLLGVPTVWMNLINHLRAEGRKLTTVKKITIGGSAVPPSMIETLEQVHGARVIHAWGMTETSPVGTVNVMLPKHAELDPAAQLAIKAKQGRPVFGIDLRLVDDDGAVLPHDGKSSGHLHVRGPWVASSYFRREGTDATFSDGWFDTGDIATLDADAYLQITDRSKDVIKSGGEWISSIDLENAAMSHPGVAQAAAIGVSHPKWSERPLLVVVRAAGADVTADALRAYLETKLEKWWLPDAIEFLDALPLGATGKVLKRELRARFADYQLPG